jgi:hypothetical protein
MEMAQLGEGKGKMEPLGKGKMEPLGKGKMEPLGKGKMEPLGEGERCLVFGKELMLGKP